MIRIEAGYLMLDPRIEALGVNVNSVTINGGHISAKINDKPTDLRGGAHLGENWYDQDHQALMRALATAEEALLTLLVNTIKAQKTQG